MVRAVCLLAAFALASILAIADVLEGDDPAPVVPTMQTPEASPTPVADVTEVRASMESGFGMTWWWPFIQDIVITSRWIEIRTGFRPASRWELHEAVAPICGAAMSSAPSGTDVRVLADDGRTLVHNFWGYCKWVGPR